jgi:hypothetical protein
MAGIRRGSRTRIGRTVAGSAVTAFLLLGVAACGSSSGSDSSSKATTTAAPSDKGTTTTEASSTTAAEETTTTEAQSSAPKLGDTFYEDDFKDASKGWPQGDTADQTETLHSDYATPLYTVVVKKADSSTTLHPEFRGIKQEQLRDYAVTAEIQTTLQVASNDDFGVTCRVLNGARYEFTMTDPTSPGEAGTWVIQKYDGTKYTQQAHGSYTPQGSAWSITGICTGGHDGDPAQLTMLINGEKVGEATDADSPLEEGYGGVFFDSHDGRSVFNVLSFATSAVS